MGYGVGTEMSGGMLHHLSVPGNPDPLEADVEPHMPMDLDVHSQARPTATLGR